MRHPGVTWARQEGARYARIQSRLSVIVRHESQIRICYRALSTSNVAV